MLETKEMPVLNICNKMHAEKPFCIFCVMSLNIIILIIDK